MLSTTLCGLEPGPWCAGGSLPTELSLAEFGVGGPLLMVVGRLLLFLKQGRVGVGGCSKFSFSFF
jgi:hypothetical protein